MYTGRIDRTGFFVGTLFLIVPVMLGIILYGLLEWWMGELTTGGGGIFQHFHSLLFVLLFFVGLVWVVITMPAYIGLYVRRLHDMDLPGWIAILNFVPFVSSALYVVLLFYPGMFGENRYGKPCSPRDPAYILFAKKLYHNEELVPPVPPPIDIPPPR